MQPFWAVETSASEMHFSIGQGAYHSGLFSCIGSPELPDRALDLFARVPFRVSTPEPARPALYAVLIMFGPCLLHEFSASKLLYDFWADGEPSLVLNR